MKLFYILILLTIHLFGSTIEKAKDLFDNQEKYKEAIEIFSKFKNDAETEYYFGKAYYYGLGVEKDLKKSFEYAKKSADKNNSSGLNLLGLIYSDGEVVNKDEKLALNYYNKAADLGNVKAIKNLASMYENGKYVKQDIAKAKELYQKLIDLNDKDGYLGIANIYTYHENNYQEALKYYNIFESLGGKHPSVFQNMAVIYRNSNNTQKEIEYHRKASELGNNHSMLTLFDLLKIEKNYKYKLNENEHFNYLIKSAEHGNTDAILEILYNDELHKVISNEALFSWLKKGVDLKLELAYIPMYGYYIDKNDYINLKKFLEKSYYEDKNLEMGCYLSSFYLNLTHRQHEKTDLEKSFIIANEIVEKNPKANNLGTCYRTLSYLYEDGGYLAKDIKKAIEIRKKSSDISYEFDKQKDLKYIDEKEQELKHTLKLFEKKDNNDKRIYSTINNFTKKEQVNAVLETNKYFFFSVSDKSIKMYDKENLSFLKEFRPWISDGMNGNPLQMTFDENTNILYFSTLNSIKDFSKNDLIHGIDINNGKIIKTLKNINAIKNTYLDISDDGKYVVAINNKFLINIINTENNKIQHYNLGDPIVFLAANIIKEDDDYVVNVVNTDKKLYKFSIKLARNISIEDFNFQTNFRSSNETYAEKIFENINNMNIENVKINSKDNIEFGVRNKVKEFDLNNLIVNKQDKSKNSYVKNNSYLMINQKYDGKIIEFLNIKTKNKKEYFLLGDVKLLKSYPIKDNYILLITSDITFMPILNHKGEIIANLQGFSAFPKDIFIKNDKLLYLGLDNIIQHFNLGILDKLHYIDNEYDDEALNGFSTVFNNSKEEIIENLKNLSHEELENLKNTNKLSFTPTKDQVNNFFQLFIHKKETIYPTFSLYLKNENDWILYTPEGLFDYSGNGKDLLKYHQNQGLYKEAKIIENDKLFEKFYRPDLIKKILAGEKVEIPIDVKSVILNIMPPELKFLENKMISNKDIELTYQICDAGNGIADQKLIINGQAIIPPQSRDFSIQKSANRDNNCSVYKSIHTLYPGKSYIELKAYDKDMNIANTSNKLEVNTDYKIIEKTDNLNTDELKKLEKNDKFTILEKSNLYFLSLAVSNYEDSSYNLKYPVKDVNSVKENFLKNSKTTFENIYTYKLENDQVTKNNINDIFNEISSKLKFNDTFVLYIAGHGSTIDGKYEFIPYKINEKISINDIKNNLSKIANYTNKSLVMLDTCYSGALIDNLNDEATSKRFSHDNKSINYIVASSSSQVALEGYKDQGVFTYSVLDAFKNNEKLKVSNLAEHVLKLVPQITEEKFHYRQNPQIKLNENFIIINN